MTRLAIAEKTILFLNNMAGDDLWEYGHLILDDHSEGSVPHEHFRFSNASRANYNSDGLYMTSISYSLGRGEKVQLYGFPFLPIEVDPSDIEFHSPISGVIVTVDMRLLDYFIKQDPQFRYFATPQTSRLAWAKDQGLPTVLAVHDANGHKGKMENLSRLVGMDVPCRVLWHDGEPNARFFHNAIKAVLSEC